MALDETTGGTSASDIAKMYRQRIPTTTRPGVYTSPVSSGLGFPGGTAGATGYSYADIKPNVSAQDEANYWIEYLSGLNKPTAPATTGGGGQNRAALQAIQTLRGRMGQPSVYDTLGTQLSTITGEAEEKIRQAGREAAQYYAQPIATPTTGAAMTTPLAAMADYLGAIGAGGSELSANQQIANSILQSIAGSTQQYSQGLADIERANRAMLAGMVPANVTAGLTNVAAAQAAQRIALEQAKAKEQADLENQILQLMLEYGVTG
jgi:hypothetical protein